MVKIWLGSDKMTWFCREASSGDDHVTQLWKGKSLFSGLPSGSGVAKLFPLQGPKVPSNSEQKAKSKHLLDCNVKTPHGSIDRSITLPANLRLHKMINNQKHHEAHYYSGTTGSCSNTLLCFVTVTQVFHIEANSIVSALVLFVDTFVLRLNVKMCFIM